MEIKLKAGKKYSICSCGLSGSLPFCDNAHRKFNAENDTEYKSVKITPEDDINESLPNEIIGPKIAEHYQTRLVIY